MIRFVVAIVAAIGVLSTITLAAVVDADGAEARAGAVVGPIDTYDRARVAASFQTHVVENRTVGHEWSGNASACRAGSSSDAFDGATLETINWFRRMAGLPPVIENRSASASAQETALMMEAQNNLSHFPGSNWACHTRDGAASAGLSNLTLGISGSRGVLGQIEDPGAGNEALGHRRWLLYPPLASVGIGNTARAGAVSVIGDFGQRPAATSWVAWPPAGYVPAETVYDRWSLSFSGTEQADFSNAVITMSENDRPVPVRRLPNANGYGDNTLGWEPVGIAPAQGRDVRYSISVSNIVIDGRSTTRSYDVVAFDPGSSATLAASASVSAAGAHECRGQAATIVGTHGDDVIIGTPGRDVIVGLDGNDDIRGGGGNDIICAGPGNDTAHGDDGNDIIFGGIGRDVLRGGAGADLLSGQNGRDRLAGNQGDDVLLGGNQGDTLVGNTGRDDCWGLRSGARSTAVETRRTCESGGS